MHTRSAAERLPGLVMVRVSKHCCYRRPPLLWRTFPHPDDLKALVSLMGVCSAWRRALLPLCYCCVCASRAVSLVIGGSGLGSKVGASFQPRLDACDYPHLVRYVRVDVDTWIWRLQQLTDVRNSTIIYDTVIAALNTLVRAIPVAMPNASHVVLIHGSRCQTWSITAESLINSVGWHPSPGLTQILHLTTKEYGCSSVYSANAATPVLAKLWITFEQHWSYRVGLVRRNSESLEHLNIVLHYERNFDQLFDGLVYPRLATLVVKQCLWHNRGQPGLQDINQFPRLAVLDFEGCLPFRLYRTICTNRLHIQEAHVIPTYGSAEQINAALAASAQYQATSLDEVYGLCRDKIQVKLRTEGCPSTNSLAMPFVSRPTLAHVKITRAKFTIEETVSIVRLCPELVSAWLSLCISPAHCLSCSLTGTAIRDYRRACSVRGASIRKLTLERLDFASAVLSSSYVVLLADLLPTITNVSVLRGAANSQQLTDSSIQRALRRSAFQSSEHLKRVKFELGS